MPLCDQEEVEPLLNLLFSPLYMKVLCHLCCLFSITTDWHHCLTPLAHMHRENNDEAHILYLQYFMFCTKFVHRKTNSCCCE